MRTTHGTATLPTNSQASHSPGRRSDERGIITLEWLLIVGAVAGLAASSVLAVQRVLDDTSEVPVDPLVRVLEADIAAAFVTADAQAAFDEDPALYVSNNTDLGFSTRCNPGVSDAFNDVVDSAVWEPPDDPNGTPLILTDDEPANCKVPPKQNLGGS